MGAILNMLAHAINLRNTQNSYERNLHKKYNALKRVCPYARFYNTRMIKGGWNIGFIVNNQYVFKIRKFLKESVDVNRIVREKRITDAFKDMLPIQIPNIEILNVGQYTFFRYNYIRGVNLNTCSLKTMRIHVDEWAKTIAHIICITHNARPEELKDLVNDAGDGWNHNDICNNMIIDKKTKKIVGLIDWEYSGINDPMADFAALFIEAGFTEDNEDFILKEYFDDNVIPTTAKQKILIRSGSFLYFIIQIMF